LWCGGSHLHKQCPEKIPILPIIGAADMQRMMYRKNTVAKDTQDYNGKGVLF
jgi:hypothetical protein